MNTAVDTKKQNKKRKRASLNARRARMGWIFVLPFILGLVLVYLPVVIESISYSLADYNLIPAIQGGGYTLTWVGFDNYEKAFSTVVNSKTGETFIEMMVTDLGKQAVDIVAILMLSLFIAVLLNQKMVGRAAFRAIFFLPVVLATGVMEAIEAGNVLGTMMGSGAGIDDGSGSSAANELVSAMDFEALFSSMKIGGELVDYTVSIINDIYAIVNRSGVQMLIFLSGLQSISPAIYEACKIDGATGWETFWKVTFPMISPMILVNAVYTIIDSFTTGSNQVMTYIANAPSSIPVNGTEVATAMSWMYFLVVVVILAAVAGIMSSFVFYQRKD